MRNRWWLVMPCVAVAGIVGCHGLARSRSGVQGVSPQTRPTTTSAPTTTRPGIDPAVALLPLESIPPVAAMPSGTEDPNREIPPQAIKHYLNAREMFQAWMNADAIEELQKALRYDPGSFEAHLMLGRTAARSGNVGQARNHLREAARIRPDDVACQYLLGWLASGAKDSAEAILRYRLALLSSNASSNRAETILSHYYLAEELMGQGYLSAAIEQFEAFEEATHPPYGAYLQNRELLAVIRSRPARPAQMIGQAALELHRYAQASEAFARALRIEPNDLRTKVRYAQSLARMGTTDGALRVARDLVLSKDQTKAGVELMGWILKDAGQPDRLAIELRTLVEAHPDRSDLGVMLAESLLAAGQKAEAEQILRKLIQVDPKLVIAYERLAILLVDQDRWVEALRVLAQAVEGGTEIQARVMRVALQMGGQTKIASQIVDRAGELLEKEPKNFALCFVIGWVAFGADRQDLAIKCFDTSMEANPKYLPAYLALGRLYIERFEWAKAIDVAEKAARAGLKDASVMYLMARGLDGLDRFEPAEAAYQAVIQADAKSVAAMVSLGELYERVGQRNKAQQQYQRALKVAPGNDQAGERLVRLLLTQGEGNEAQEELERLRRAGGSGPALGRCLAIMMARGDIGRYRKLLGDILTELPKDIETRYDLAASYYATRDYTKASEQLDQILKLSPGYQKARHMMAEICRKRLDQDSAAQWMLGLLREHPNREAWWVALNEIYLDAQDNPRAVEVLQKLITLASNKTRRSAYRLRLVGIYNLMKEQDKAIASAREWLKEDPSSTAARRTLMEALQEAGRAAEAVTLAEEWVSAAPLKNDKRDPDEPELAMEEDRKEDDPKTPGDERRNSRRGMLLSAYMAAKQYDQALATVVRWTEADPTDQWLMGQHWLVLTNAKRYDDAALLARAAITQGKQARLYQLMLAQSHLKAKRYDEAMEVLSQIPQAERDDQVDALEVEVLIAAKRYDQAERRAREIVAKNTDEQVRLAYSRVLLVPVYHRIGREELAVKELERLYAKQPQDAGLCNDLGYTYADAGRNLDQAERMLRFALGEEPRNSAYMDSLAWALYKKGDFRGATHLLGKAIRAQGGQDAVIYDHLGDAWWRLGNQDEAAKSWKKAAELGQKELAEEKESADPKLLPRVREKLGCLEKGQEPVVAVVIGGPATSTAPKGSVATQPAGK